MSTGCALNCLVCGKCASLPILEVFSDADIATQANERREGYGISVDLGTTTAVLALVDLNSGTVITRQSFINPQRIFGPDVISRIDAANKGSLNEMRGLISQTINHAVNELTAAAGASPEKIIDVVIAGNTTMIYLLLGLPCESLGVLPFIPAHNLSNKYLYNDIFGITSINCEVKIFPWFSAFVGGDVMAGLVFVSLMEKQRFIFLDLGTNGEMVLYDDGKLIITSTAAGPAFEGIEQGGASSTISKLAKLLRNGVIDDTGFLSNELVFTQKQVRNLQLAKSAIRSGLEILLLEGGLTYDDVDAVYLAGGIGQAMNVADAVKIGLIPYQLENKAFSIGNSSLGGAVRFLTTPTRTAKTINSLYKNFTEINLAAHRNFNDMFMEYMFFG